MEIKISTIIDFFDVWMALSCALVMCGVVLALTKLKLSLIFMAIGVFGFFVWIIFGLILFVYVVHRKSKNDPK